MSLYKDDKSPNWFYSITVKGQRIRGSTGTADKQEAQRFHDELKADLWKRKSSGKSWLDAATAWLLAAERNESDRYRLKAFTLPDLPLEDLTAEEIEKHLAGVPGTYNRMVNLVNAVLNLAKNKGWIDTIPKLTKKKETPGRIRWLTREEWERLRAELPPHLKAMAIFAVATGLRQANVTQLEWSQVDLARRVAWVHPDQAKAKKPIGIPLSDEAVTVLREQLGRHDTRVFTYTTTSKKNGTRVRPIDNIKAAWSKALQRAGLGHWEEIEDDKEGKLKFVPNCCWHDLRHTWATWHIQAGTPLEVLQRLGGWSDIKMVLRYAHLDPGYLAGFANNARPYSQKESQNAA